MPNTSLRAFRVHSVALAAGATEVINATGNYIAALTATGAFSIGLDDNGLTPWEAGLSANLEPGETYSKVRITDLSGAPNTVEMCLGYGQFKDARFTLLGSITTSPTKATAFASVPDVVCGAAGQTILAVALATRRQLIVSNLAANASTIRVGDVGAAAGEGVELAPGQTLIVDTAAAVYAWNPGAVQSVAVVSVDD